MKGDNSIMNNLYLAKFLEEGRSLYTRDLEFAIANLTEELENRKKNEREKLRQELMGNLQKAISDVLHNDFILTIKNTERNHEDDDYDEVYFDTDDIYSIDMIDTK
jgi:hypothetical protein